MHKNNKYYRVAIIITIVAVSSLSVALIANAINGRTEITKTSYPEVSNTSLRCNNKVDAYPFFVEESPQKTDITLDLIFTNKAVKTIALTNILEFHSKEEASSSKIKNSASMDLSFYDHGFGTDAFNAKYTQIDNIFKMTLYLNGQDLNMKSAPFFMIDTEKISKLPETMEEFRTLYSTKNFMCTVNNN